jgi:hypothetical protein
VVLGGQPPSPAELLSATRRGTLAGVVLRHARIRPGEIETVGGAPVTVPVRTALDLLRFSPVPVAAPLLDRLVASGHLEERDVDRHLQRMHRHPGIRLARERWEEARALSSR